MTREEFQHFYPLLSAWIAATLRQHARQAQTVATAGFPQLPLYFSAEFLGRAKFVAVDAVPIPPLTAMGLSQFAAFEQLDAAGITYLDTYFVRRDQVGTERLHAHELVHVAQWEVLGPEHFLAAYAEGLERFGYRDSPLELMAYTVEEEFARGGAPFDAVGRVRRKLAGRSG